MWRSVCILAVEGGVLLIRLEGVRPGHNGRVNLEEWKVLFLLLGRSLPPGLGVLTSLEEPLLVCSLPCLIILSERPLHAMRALPEDLANQLGALVP